ncbi:hypothetical protein ANRL2_02466 [Anaerolineae bacterium]|nr:hypothetical protein ANRL2_02466 [Anaerolineae bacterium]
MANPFDITQRDERIFCGKANCPGSTGLKCYRTGVPICMKCAVKTPVGYISKETAREQADKYFNIASYDYIIATLVAFGSLLVSGVVLVRFIPFFYFMFLIGGAVGGGIAEIVWRAIRYKRGRYTTYAVGAGMIAATLLLILLSPLNGAIFGGIATSVALSRFRFQLRV